jgi:hypothetical protein
LYANVATGEKVMKFFGHTIPVMMIVPFVLGANVPSDTFVFWIEAIPASHPNDSDALFTGMLPLVP